MGRPWFRWRIDIALASAMLFAFAGLLVQSRFPRRPPPRADVPLRLRIERTTPPPSPPTPVTPPRQPPVEVLPAESTTPSPPTPPTPMTPPPEEPGEETTPEPPTEAIAPAGGTVTPVSPGPEPPPATTPGPSPPPEPPVEAEGPAAPEETPTGAEPEPGQFRYFGHLLPLETREIVFLLDVSGSMSPMVSAFRWADGHVARGSRLDRAREELKRTLAELAPEIEVNVVAYADAPALWQLRPVRMAPEERVGLDDFLSSLRPLGSTDTARAVRAALLGSPRATLVLLSDGLPSPPDEATPPEEAPAIHRARIRQANTEGAVIHTIGFDVDVGGRAFLRDVADDAGGIYREAGGREY